MVVWPQSADSWAGEKLGSPGRMASRQLCIAEQTASWG